jgi:hypothetical protein
VFSCYHTSSLLSKESKRKRRKSGETTTPKKQHHFTDKLQMLADRDNTLLHLVPNITPPPLKTLFNAHPPVTGPIS